MSINTKLSFAFLAVALGACSPQADRPVEVAADSQSTVLTCLEFVSPDDQSVFNSTSLIRAGTKISAKTKQDCKGVYMQDVVVKCCGNGIESPINSRNHDCPKKQSDPSW